MSEPRNIRAIAPFGLRLPSPLKGWVQEQATANGSSQNSEVVRAVRERKQRVEAEAAHEQ